MDEKIQAPRAASCRQLRVGLAGMGLQAYWNQFEGLQQRLTSYVDEVAHRMAGAQCEVHLLGLVDTPQKSIEASHACRRADVDLLFVYMTTYALSSTVLPIIARAKVPVILLNLQPDICMDYARVNAMEDRVAMTAEWLAFCSSCAVPEITNVLRRLKIPFRQVTGALQGDAGCWLEIEEWLRAADVVTKLGHARLGLMGHYYSGMLDIATDLTQVSGRFGLHIEIVEVDSLSALRRDVEEGQLRSKLDAFNSFFEVDQDCSAAELERSARTAVALDRFIRENELDLLAYCYSGTGIAENLETMTSIILGASLLTGQGIPIAGEDEVKNAIAMKILDLLGAGGSFTEFYAIDFKDDLVLMGHDGPGHYGIAQEKIRVRGLRAFHGKVGSGLSVEMSVACGPVTLLSIVEDAVTGFRLVVAEGESVPGKILKIGNTNSRYRFTLGARGFVEAWNSFGPAHHSAIGIGHLSSVLEKAAFLMGMSYTQVC